MKPLKIGILINPARELADWEARLFSTLLNDARYEVVCTIKDGRISKNKKSLFQNIINAILDGRLPKILLVRIIYYCERRFRKGNMALSFDKADVSDKISALPSIEVMPKRKGFLDVFSKEDCGEIEKLNLDVLLRHQFSIIRGPILKVPKYGIWSFHHADNKVNRGLPSGFWEVYNNSSVTGVTLQVLEDELDGGKVIQKGFYNTKKYWYLNNEAILEKSVELILKHLRLLYENRELRTKPSGVYSKELFRSPSFFQAFNYILKRYPKVVFRRIWRKLRPEVDDSKNVWKLHIGRGSIENAVLWRSKTIEPPSNEYWADPFLFEHKKLIYVFFENYEYSKKKGKISVGIIKERQIAEISDALDVDYHLSYPFIFEHNNAIFMIPETSVTKRLEIWKCDNFPNNWSLEKICFEGVSLADSTIAKDSNNQFWLFTNISYDKFDSHNNYLYVFKIDSPMMSEIIPHKLNPVVSDCRSARNAGNIYIDNRGRLIRPSQANRYGIYGQSLNLCHVRELTIDTYEEEVLEMITPEFKKGLQSVHHVSQVGGIFVIDGCYKNRC